MASTSECLHISELLDDHREALKERDGEIADLHRRVEELSAAEKVATEISRLRANLDHEAVLRSNRKELKQHRRELEKKGLEMLKRDSEL